ncbi:MAG: methylase, partial [Oscillospiraceae bacterium]|nr:methylase [Oscillospiraceae bacterium]
MTEAQQRAAAKQFALDWKDKGDEKQETQRFWIDLLQQVFGVERPTEQIAFEVPVKLE